MRGIFATGLSDRTAHLDLETYLVYAATEMVLGHWDGYAWSTNNFMIHHGAEDDRWTFVPWGIDQLFEDPLGPYAGVMRHTGPAWVPGPGGRVHEMCFASAALKRRSLPPLAAGAPVLVRVDLAPGVDGQEAIERLRKLDLNAMVARRGVAMAKGDFAASFELAMARKDVGLMIETIGNGPMAALPAIAARMDELIAAGHGAKDASALGL